MRHTQSLVLFANQVGPRQRLLPNLSRYAGIRNKEADVLNRRRRQLRYKNTHEERECHKSKGTHFEYRADTTIWQFGCTCNSDVSRS